MEYISSTTSSNPLEVHHTYWIEMHKTIELPPPARNIFIDLAEHIAMELTVTNCYVCGGTNMREQWPWEARQLEYTTDLQPLNLSWCTHDWPTCWLSNKESIVGKDCVIRNNYSNSIGDTKCLSGIICDPTETQTVFPINYTWINPCDQSTHTPLHQVWEDPCNRTLTWVAPNHLYWICGNQTWAELPPDWGALSSWVSYDQASSYYPYPKGNTWESLSIRSYTDTNVK